MKSASANDSRIVIPAEAGMTGILRLWDSSAGKVFFWPLSPLPAQTIIIFMSTLNGLS